MAALLLGVACQRENPQDSTPAVKFGNVPVTLGQAPVGDETRSLVSINVEDFQVASLFAFYHDTGKIAVYPEHAGDLEGTGPVAIEVTEKTFNWALPIGQALDIYVIVNYGESLTNTIASYRQNANLTTSMLDQLKFTVRNFDTMSDIAASGIPMAGIVHTTLASDTTPLNVTVKRLYARYNIYFDTSDIDAVGARLQALHIITENVNTEIPFFQEGFKQTNHSKLQEYDRATAVDLDVIQQGGNGKQLTLYVPENCQGDIAGASDWKTVASLGSKVLNCTYVDFGVKIVDTDGLWKNYNFFLYLGTDFKSNFDVRRNYNTTVSIKIPYGPIPPVNENYFYWSDHNLVTVEPGESVELEYSTNLKPENVKFVFTEYETGNVVTNAFVKTDGVDGSSVTFKASSSLANGAKYIVTGGSEALLAQDQKPLQINSLTPLRLTWSISYDEATGFPYLLFRTTGNNAFNGSIGLYFNIALNYGQPSPGSPVDNSFPVILRSNTTDYSFYYGTVGPLYVTFRNGSSIVPFNWDTDAYDFSNYELSIECVGVIPDSVTPTNYTVPGVTPGAGDIQYYSR